MICAQRKFGKEVIYTTVNSKTTIITTKREIYFRINKQTQKLEKCILELTFGGRSLIFFGQKLYDGATFNGSFSFVYRNY